MAENFDIHYKSPKVDYMPYEDTSFVIGETGRVLDIHGDLDRETYNGEIVNDGPGDLGIELSADGVAYGGLMTVKPAEKLDVTTFKLFKMRLTWIANTGYRARFW